MRWSHRLGQLDARGDEVAATVERLEKESAGYAVARTEWAVAETLAMRAGFVVGADGHRSLVRRALGTRFDEVAPSQAFAIFECRSKGASDEMRLVLDPQWVAALWPLPGGRAALQPRAKGARGERGRPLQEPADHEARRALLPAPRRGAAHAQLLHERRLWLSATRPLEIGWSIRGALRAACFAGGSALAAAGRRCRLRGPPHRDRPGCTEHEAGLARGSS